MRPAATPKRAAPEPGTPEVPASGRGADLRVARLHLRCGSYALARAELEALAGADALDRDGILDLAEVRWRTGDVAGAAVAAAAWLEDGEDTGAPGALAHVISAEAAAAGGAPAAAAVHVDAAVARLGDRSTLELVLAGIPPYAAWPWGAAASPPPPTAAPGQGAAPAVTASAAARDGRAAKPPVAAAAAELLHAATALAGEAPERAAVLLALALRADRAAAEAVLTALDGLAVAEPASAHAAAVAFLRAEALRAAGRHEEARIAYASAEHLALAPVEGGPHGVPRD